MCAQLPCSPSAAVDRARQTGARRPTLRGGARSTTASPASPAAPRLRSATSRAPMRSPVIEWRARFPPRRGGPTVRLSCMLVPEMPRAGFLLPHRPPEQAQVELRQLVDVRCIKSGRGQPEARLRLHSVLLSRFAVARPAVTLSAVTMPRVAWTTTPRFAAHHQMKRRLAQSAGSLPRTPPGAASINTPPEQAPRRPALRCPGRASITVDNQASPPLRDAGPRVPVTA